MNGADDYQAFLRAWPAYASTTAIDVLRQDDFRRLDDRGIAYLDYTGAGLYGASQIAAHAALLDREVLGNPHSASASSVATTTLVERTRQHVLDFFGAPPGEYVAVFTANASGALKHVGEGYPFGPGSRLAMTFDNHNSVNGIREFALAKGAAVEYVPLTLPELRIDPDTVQATLERADPTLPNLFAYPAQSNFSGVKHSLGLIERAHALGWDVLLDAAAFVPTNRLDLAIVKPDFVSVSFYKMFGYPTGVGCLLARRAALGRLRRPWFAGGTVNFASVQGQAHTLAPAEAGFEDGTLDFLSIPAVAIGLAKLEALGLPVLQSRLNALTGWLLGQLLELRHSTGRHMVRIYGPTRMVERGATVTMNFYDPEGHLLDYRRVEELGGAQRLSVRTGCFCNPGAGETAEGLTEEDMRAAAAAGDMTLPRFVEFMRTRGGKSAGAIRVSLGLVSNFEDVRRFVQFAAGLRDQTRLAMGEVSFDIESCRVIRDGA